MQAFGYSMLWYWLAYCIVTAIGVCHTLYNAKVKGMGVMGRERVPMNQIESYAKTMPFHPLYNILVFPIGAGIYLKGLGSPTVSDAVYTGLLWLGITAVFDLIGWVLVPHPFHCTFRDFYVDYQPWITIIYVVILASPLIALALMRLVGA